MLGEASRYYCPQDLLPGKGRQIHKKDKRKETVI